MEGQNKRNPVLSGVIILLILALAYGVFKYVKKDDEVVGQQNVTTTIPNSSLYRNGSYSSVGNYFSPGGEESINVSVTLKDDVITDATVISNASRPVSIKMQGIFIANYKPLVVGKKIDDVVLDKVSGSSLTPIGFNNALESIKVTAKI